MRQDLVVAVDLDPEVPAGEVRALGSEQVEQERQRLLLHVAPSVEVLAEAFEFIGAIARSKAHGHAAAAEHVDEGGVLDHAHGVGEGQGDDAGADPDPLRQRGEVPRIDEHVGHDAVLVAEVVLGDPGEVEAQRVRPHHLARHARMHIVVRVGLRLGIGVGGEQDTEFHTGTFLDTVSPLSGA